MSGSVGTRNNASVAIVPALPGPVISTGTQITTQYGTVDVATTTNLTNKGGLVTTGKTGGIQPLDGGTNYSGYVVDGSIYDPGLGDFAGDGDTDVSLFGSAPAGPTPAQLGALHNAESGAASLSFDVSVGTVGFAPTASNSTESNAADNPYILTAVWENQMVADGDVGNWPQVATDGDELRHVLANLPIEATDITSCYQCDLSRNPSTGELAVWQNDLANYALTFSTFLSDVGNSAEAAADINQKYVNILNRPVDAGSLTYDQNGLVTGATTQYIIGESLAVSFEAYQDINDTYGNELARPVDSGSLATDQNWLTNGIVTMQYLHYYVAYSPEAATDIVAFYNRILDRNPSSTEISGWQNDLNNGSLTFSGVEAAIANSPESASELRLVILSVQGRQATGNDVPWITAQQASEAAGTTVLNSIGSSLALWSGETPIVSDYYQLVTGVAPAAALVSGEQAALSTGSQILPWVSGLTSSTSGITAIDAWAADNGQYAPQSYTLTYTEEAMANLAQAIVTVQNDSVAQLQSLATEYTAPTTYNQLTFTELLASSEQVAQAVVSSALSNSYVDGAPDQVTIQQLLTSGGSILYETILNQAQGLSAAQLQAQFGGQGCTNVPQFIANNVTGLANSTIAAANGGVGITWSSNQPAGANANTKIQGAGVPYENYVTNLLQPQGYVATNWPYPTFDQWNKVGRIAVSDKTVDTNPTTSYAANPSTITTLMVSWATKMLGFVGRPTSVGPSVPSAKIEGGISQDTLYMGVSSNTTSAEWTAICLGKQDMLSMFASAVAAGQNFQTLNVVINSVSG